MRHTFLAPKLIDNASITTSTTAAITLKSVSSTINLTASPTIEGLTTTGASYKFRSWSST